jgi:hypothetical protein
MLRQNAKCRIICVDAFKGDTSINGPKHQAREPEDVYLQWVRNLWPYIREGRVQLLRMDGRKAMRHLRACGVRPDLIYLDMGHHYTDVRGDLDVLRECFPDVPIVGDDIGDQNGHPGVGKAVAEIAQSHKQIEGVEVWQNCYALQTPSRRSTYVVRPMHFRMLDSSSSSSSSNRLSSSPTQQSRRLVMIIPIDTSLSNATEVEAKCVAHMASMVDSYAPKHLDVSLIVVRAKDPTGKRPHGLFNKGWLCNVAFLVAQHICKLSPDAVVFQDPMLLPPPELAPFYWLYPHTPTTLSSIQCGFTFQRWFLGTLLVHPHDFRRINGYPNNVVGWDGWDFMVRLRLAEVGLTLGIPRTPKTAKQTPLMFPRTHNNQPLAVHTSSEWNDIKRKDIINRHSVTWAQNGLQDVPVSRLQSLVTVQSRFDSKDNRRGRMHQSWVVHVAEPD